MTPLQIALIEKTGWSNGFEYVAESMPSGVTLASARHPTRVAIRLVECQYLVTFSPSSPALIPELKREFVAQEHAFFAALDENHLAELLHRAAKLAQALPSQAAEHYAKKVTDALSELPPEIMGTEVERLVRQRVGQQTFRQAQMEYWGGACAVTGIAIPEVLRASHAKPWAECESDAERLDVFNGFLLSANLDALFDQFLISFSEAGLLLSASRLESEFDGLGISKLMRLRWISSAHVEYLSFHRERFEKKEKGNN